MSSRLSHSNRMTAPAGGVAINQQLVKKLFRASWQYEGTDIRPDALRTSAELTRLFTKELLHRAVLVARTRDSGSSVDVADLERVLIQAMLDFKM